VEKKEENFVHSTPSIISFFKDMPMTMVCFAHTYLIRLQNFKCIRKSWELWHFKNGKYQVLDKLV